MVMMRLRPYHEQMVMMRPYHEQMVISIISSSESGFPLIFVSILWNRSENKTYHIINYSNKNKNTIFVLVLSSLAQNCENCAKTLLCIGYCTFFLVTQMRQKDSIPRQLNCWFNKVEKCCLTMCQVEANHDGDVGLRGHKPVLRESESVQN